MLSSNEALKELIIMIIVGFGAERVFVSHLILGRDPPGV